MTDTSTIAPPPPPPPKDEEDLKETNFMSCKVISCEKTDTDYLFRISVTVSI